MIYDAGHECRCCCSAGAAGFPGGMPGGMPGLGEFLKDPELLNAMKVTYSAALVVSGS